MYLVDFYKHSLSTKSTRSIGLVLQIYEKVIASC